MLGGEYENKLKEAPYISEFFLQHIRQHRQMQAIMNELEIK
jgi:hypothetical protein